MESREKSLEVQGGVLALDVRTTRSQGRRKQSPLQSSETAQDAHKTPSSAEPLSLDFWTLELQENKDVLFKSHSLYSLMTAAIGHRHRQEAA